MKCFVILITIKTTVFLSGILWGALFFPPCSLSAQDDALRKDAEVIQDSSKFMKAFRQKKGIVRDSSLKNSPDTIITLSDTSFSKSKDTILILNNTTSDNPNDTIVSIKEIPPSKKKKAREHSPPRATILSAVVPGLGQAYNRKYWKIPIIYVAGGALYYYFDLANGRFNLSLV